MLGFWHGKKEDFDICLRCEEALFRYISLHMEDPTAFRRRVQQATDEWRKENHGIPWKERTPEQQALVYLNVHIKCLLEMAESKDEMQLQILRDLQETLKRVVNLRR